MLKGPRDKGIKPFKTERIAVVLQIAQPKEVVNSVGDIFTKADKVKPLALERNIQAYTEKMLETWEEMPTYFITSASNSMGRDEVLGYIGDLNNTVG